MNILQGKILGTRSFPFIPHISVHPFSCLKRFIFSAVAYPGFHFFLGGGVNLTGGASVTQIIYLPSGEPVTLAVVSH